MKKVVRKREIRRTEFTFEVDMRNKCEELDLFFIHENDYIEKGKWQFLHPFRLCEYSRKMGK